MARAMQRGSRALDHGTRLKMLCIAHNVKDADLCALIGRGQKLVTALLKGERTPRPNEQKTIENWVSATFGAGWIPGLWDVGDIIRQKKREKHGRLGRWLAQYKEDSGRSWTDIARETGIPRTTLYDFAQGEIERSGKKPAGKLADALERLRALRENAGEKGVSGKNHEYVFSCTIQRSKSMRLSPEFLTDKLLEHFGLAEDPCSSAITSADEIWVTPQVRKALEIVSQGIRRRKGIVAFHGRSGSGKSVILKAVLQDLRTGEHSAKLKTVLFADLATEELTPGQFLHAIYKEICPRKPMSVSIPRLQRALVDELVAMAESGKQLVVIIDEAHGLSASMLKGLKRFIELVDKDPRVGFSFPMLVALFGHDELLYNIEGANMEEVKGRMYLCEIAMAGHQVYKYVEHRLSLALSGGRGPWDVVEKEGIAELVKGLKTAAPGVKEDDVRITPLDVNIVLSRALKRAFEMKEKNVTRRAVVEALRIF